MGRAIAGLDTGMGVEEMRALRRDALELVSLELDSGDLGVSLLRFLLTGLDLTLSRPCLTSFQSMEAST